ncbi:hypothetical protein TNCV_3257721 [Trichonephila clavipes]|nr:hypothetical protein TNCV_3257721 [Trichonephila clavipes]
MPKARSVRSKEFASSLVLAVRVAINSGQKESRGHVKEKMREPVTHGSCTEPRHQSILKWTWWHEYPSLQLRSVKHPALSNRSAYPCCVGVLWASMPMAAPPAKL